MSDKIVIEVDGKEYRQQWLPSAQALRLQSKTAKLGVMPIIEALGQSDLEQVLKGGDADAIASLAAAAYGIVQQLEPEDIEWALKLFAEHTWITTAGDGATEVRLDKLPKHFADSRDLPRLYKFVWRSLMEQLRPTIAELRTTLASSALLQK
jgi:hypothetical protein